MSETSKRLAISVKYQCNEKERADNLAIYKLPLKGTSTYSGASSIVRRFSYGKPNQQIGRRKKTILVMGATGSGKTTWINAMINYVLGVEFEDDFRFKLVDEQVIGASQANSQTQGVTAYDIFYQNGFCIPFSLTIVDTPGFGDTQGIERDKEITSAVQQFFEHENGIKVYY
jgi:septin family protein